MLKTPLSLTIFIIVVIFLGNTFSLASQDSQNLLLNGSFEQWQTGIKTMPDKWSFRLMSRQDNAKLIADHKKAHYGCRYVLLQSSGGEGIILDALQSKHSLKLEPGKKYDITVWARLEGPAINATMLIEPGNGKFELTSNKWQKYTLSYVLPNDARPEIGFYVKVKGGPVAVDDVSITPADTVNSWPEEYTANRNDIDTLKADRDWTENDKPWRFPITVREVIGQNASNVLMKIRLSDMIDYLGHEKLTPDNFNVIDSSSGRITPWVLFNSDRYEDVSCDDEIAFLANCPAKTQKTYYIYFNPKFLPVSRKALKTLPKKFAFPSEYQHKLDLEIGCKEDKVIISYEKTCGKLNVNIAVYSAKNIKASAISPDGMTQLELKLDQKDDVTWTASLPLSEDMEAGIWQIAAEIKDDQGKAYTASKTFIVDSAIWWSNGLRQIMPDDDPKYEADWVQICAAKNELESFFIAVKSNKDLQNVRLKASDMKTSDGKIIKSDNVSFELVENIQVTRPIKYGRAGWYPDPLVDWRSRDIKAANHKTASVTVSVSKNTAAGQYWGKITAFCDKKEFSIPITLEVFDFTLPDKKSLKTVLGGDMWMRPSLGYKKFPADTTDYYRDISTPKGVIAMAKLLADNYSTPFYYHHDKSPYTIIWHYNPETGTAEFDFSQFDKYADMMLNQWGQDYLFLGGKFAGGWRNPGNVWDWNKDLDIARSKYWEEAYPQHLYSLKTKEGLKMYYTYWKGVAAHFEKKGWLDKAYVYLTDEDKSEEVRQVVLKKAEMVKKANPNLKMFVASNASYRWSDYMELVNAFTGHISKENMPKLKNNNGQWWGTYNTIGMPTYPLSFTRALGIKQLIEGADVYFNWAACRIPDGLVDINQYYFVSANAGYSHADFIKDVSSWGSLGTFIYPIPENEPRPDDEYNDMFISSIRLQAIREAVEDYEYFKIAAALSDGGMKVDAQGFTASESALQKLKDLAKTSKRTIQKITYYDLDPEKYYQYKKDIGRIISNSN